MAPSSIGHFITPERFLVLFQNPVTPLTRGNHHSDFFHWRTTLSVLKLHKSAVKLVFFYLGFSLSIMFFRFIIWCVSEVCSILLGEVRKQHLCFWTESSCPHKNIYSEVLEQGFGPPSHLCKSCLLRDTFSSLLHFGAQNLLTFPILQGPNYWICSWLRL